jgi:hypothetical protein
MNKTQPTEPTQPAEVNRIELVILHTEQMIKTLPLALFSRMESTISQTSFEEHFQMQNWQAQAHASGIISFEEAQTLYNRLGPSVDHFLKQSLAAKMVIIKTCTELYQAMHNLPKEPLQ